MVHGSVGPYCFFKFLKKKRNNEWPSPGFFELSDPKRGLLLEAVNLAVIEIENKAGVEAGISYKVCRKIPTGFLVLFWLRVRARLDTPTKIDGLTDGQDVATVKFTASIRHTSILGTVACF